MNKNLNEKIEKIISISKKYQKLNEALTKGQAEEVFNSINKITITSGESSFDAYKGKSFKTPDEIENFILKFTPPDAGYDKINVRIEVDGGNIIKGFRFDYSERNRYFTDSLRNYIEKMLTFSESKNKNLTEAVGRIQNLYREAYGDDEIKKLYKIVKQIGHEIKWSIDDAMVIAVSILEEVNEHDSSKAVNDVLLKYWEENSNLSESTVLSENDPIRDKINELEFELRSITNMMNILESNIAREQKYISKWGDFNDAHSDSTWENYKKNAQFNLDSWDMFKIKRDQIKQDLSDLKRG